MIKVEVIEKFSLKDFDKIQNIKRVAVDEKGKLFVGDTFECSEEMAKYLLGDNPLKRTVVKVIEVEPIEEPIENKSEPIENEPIEEPTEQVTEPATKEIKVDKKHKKKK